MVLKCRIANCNRTKCILPLPLLTGFVFGIVSFYIYYSLLNYDNYTKLIPVAIKQDAGFLDFNYNSHYHQVDFTKPSMNNNTSLLCLIFINDIDSLFMQHNIWLDKCENKVYVSQQKHKYIGHVITETYSSHPWKYYCQTLMYIHKKYNSSIRKYDWLFLAKDDVWLIYENLMHFISLLNVNKTKHNYYAGQFIDGILTVNAGILLSANTLKNLVHLLNNMDACYINVSNNESEILDFYLKQLNDVVPIYNMDLYGCTLFHSINLYEAFNVESLEPEIRKKCMSSSAITFQLDLSPNNYAMFYKYVLHKVRLVNKQDIMSNIDDILPAPSNKDEDIWRMEALYELNLDPSKMSQPDFFYHWFKKRKIIL